MRMTIRIDRRTLDSAAVLAELNSMVESVAGLSLELSGESTEDDLGRFRDFTTVGHLEHADPAVIEWAAEELIDIFGWQVDVTQAQSER